MSSTTLIEPTRANDDQKAEDPWLRDEITGGAVEPTENSHVSGESVETERAAAIPRLMTWSGLVLSGLGFILIALAWGATAGKLALPRQLPYFSEALFGVGLVVVGVLLVALDAKLTDARRARQQQAEFCEAVLSVLERRSS